MVANYALITGQVYSSLRKRPGSIDECTGCTIQIASVQNPVLFLSANDVPRVQFHGLVTLHVGIPGYHPVAHAC